MAKKRKKPRREERPRAPRPAPLSPGLAAVLGIVGLFFVHAYFYSFTMDDAYISLRYAKNFVDGLGLVYNPGEVVEGYSNFSWTMLLAFFVKIGLPAIEMSRWLGVIFAAGAILVAARFARSLEGCWGWMTVSVALLVAANTALAYWSTSGMETGFFVFLVTLAFERGLAPGVSPRARRWVPAIFALAALTRPDAPLFFFLWLAMRAWATRRGEGPLVDPGGMRGVLRDLAMFVVPLVPYVTWKLLYYGDVLPNTYHAKAGFSLAYLSQGIDYAWEYVKLYGLWGVLPLLCLAPLRPGPTSKEQSDRRRIFAALLLPMAAYSAYVVAVGGDVLPFHRFWLTILPLGCVLLGAGTFGLAADLVVRRGGSATTGARLGFGFLVLVTSIGFAQNWERIQARRQVDLQALDRVKKIAFYLKARLGPDEAIASTANGALPYFSERPFIDMLGLTDREVATSPKYEEDLTDTWKEKKYNAPSVLKRRPAAFMFSTGIRPSSVAEKSLFLYSDFRCNYYPHEFRVSPETPWTNVIYRLRPDPGPPSDDWEPTKRREFIKHFSDALIAQGRDREFELAAEGFARAVETGPHDFFAAREWAATMRYDIGDSTVVPELEAVVAADSMALRSVSRLARWHTAHGDYAKGEELYLHFLRMNPDLPDGWEGIADIRRLNGNYEEARQYVMRSLERWNTNPTSLILFARLCIRLDDLTRAKAAYERVLLIDAQNEEAKQGVAVITKELTQGTGAQ